MGKSHDKLAKRLALIMAKLQNGEAVTTQGLSDEFNVSIKTVQRDLNERLSFLPIVRKQQRYTLEPYALGKLNFEDIKSFAAISGVKSLYPSLDDSFIVDILNDKIKKTYLVKNDGFENLHTKQESFSALTDAVHHHCHVSFVYNDKIRDIKPYKMVNNNGIWYLVGDDAGVLKNFTFSKIMYLKTLRECRFKPQKKFTDLIRKNDLQWFSTNTFDVILEIDRSVQEFFTRQEILPNKKIIESTEHTLLLSTKVSYDNEILRLVRCWIPHIKIVSPTHLVQKHYDILKEYFQTTQPVEGLRYDR
jgi:predicted DNA-binding transcriptional regulator YafY